MIIAANICKLSRVELLYTCVAKLVGYCHKNQKDSMIEGMEHYYDPNDFNRIFYYSDSSDAEKCLKSILRDVDQLLKVCGTEFEDVTEYQLFIRCLSEQTIATEGGHRLHTKEDGGFHSGMPQNPSNPDATFREKAGKEYRGYAANLKETVRKTTPWLRIPV